MCGNVLSGWSIVTLVIGCVVWVCGVVCFGSRVALVVVSQGLEGSFGKDVVQVHVVASCGDVG